MEGKKYTKVFEVHYYEINKFREATPVSILNYLEEAAVCHSWDMGVGFERLTADGYTWVLAKWLLKIDRLPLFGEKLTVETWPSGFEKFFATREFIIKDKDGNIIVRATSLWVLISIDKKRPVRIPEEISSAYVINEERAINEHFRDFQKIEAYDNIRQDYVRRSDIDTNNHVNNTKYVEWAIETIPDDVYENYYLSSLEVVYKKETAYGSMIYSSCKEMIKNDFEGEYTHSITSEDGTAELVLIYTKWKRRI